MAVPVVAATSQGSSPSGATVTVTKPSGSTAGDLLILCLIIYDADRTLSSMSGWTLIDKTSKTTADPIYTATFAADGAVADLTITLDTGTYADWMMARITGQAATPFDVTGTENFGQGTTKTATGLTTITNDSLLLIWTVGYGQALNAGSYTGWTQAIVNDLVNYLHTKSQPTAGATGSPTATTTGVEAWTTQMHAIRSATPSGGGGTTGTATNTLAPASSTAAGTPRIVGSSARNLANATSTAAGTPRIVGASAVVLAPAISTSAGTPYYTGQAANVLASAVSVAAGRPIVTGASSLLLAPVISNGQGQTGSGPAPVYGTAANVLASVTSVGAGTPRVVGASNALLAPATSAATAWTTVTGAAANVLGSVVSRGSDEPLPVPPTTTGWQAQLVCENLAVIHDRYRHPVR